MTRTTPTIPRPAPRAPRRAFTLIELMVVIVIIGILAAFLVPAAQRAIQSARVAEVTSEMHLMESGIAQFENRFGVQPPSGIVLYEQRDDGTSSTPDPGWGADSSNAPISENQRRTSRSRIRQIWPDFNFGANHDFNGDGDTNDVLYLNGAECLVFFLGGVKNANGDSVVGFAANPVNPIQNDAQAENRITPFHDFDPGRFVDTDGDTMFEYLDSLPGQTTPMLYFSSYGGRGYQPHGIDGIFNTPDDEILPVSLGRGLYSVYYTTDNNKSMGTLFPDGTPHNPNSFQILSPGYDNEYGYGGEYTSDFQLTDASNPDPNNPGSSVNRDPTYLNEEFDNITNFRNERLNP